MKRHPILEAQAHLDEHKPAAGVAFGFVRFLVFIAVVTGIVTIIGTATGWW